MANPEMSRFKDLILYNLEAGEAVLTDNNDIRVYTDGKEKFRALIEEMKQAKRYIHMQYYIIRNDELWQEVEKVLIQKAREGVEVRVLFDSMGCRTMKTVTGSASKKKEFKLRNSSRRCLGSCSFV